MDKQELEMIREELYKDLIHKSEEQINDGSSVQFCLGVSSGFYDAAAYVWNYLNERLKTMTVYGKRA